MTYDRSTHEEYETKILTDKTYVSWDTRYPLNSKDPLVNASQEELLEGGLARGMGWVIGPLTGEERMVRMIYNLDAVSLEDEIDVRTKGLSAVESFDVASEIIARRNTESLRLQRKKISRIANAKLTDLAWNLGIGLQTNARNHSAKIAETLEAGVLGVSFDF